MSLATDQPRQLAILRHLSHKSNAKPLGPSLATRAQLKVCHEHFSVKCCSARCCRTPSNLLAITVGPLHIQGELVLFHKQHTPQELLTRKPCVCTDDALRTSFTFHRETAYHCQALASLPDSDAYLILTHGMPESTSLNMPGLHQLFRLHSTCQACTTVADTVLLLLHFLLSTAIDSSRYHPYSCNVNEDNHDQCK